MDIVGIDIGSRSIEVAALREGELVLARRAEATFDPLGRAEALLNDLSPDLLVATGYGRGLLAARRPARTVTEIQAYALGARRLFPECRAVLDMGGQDAKAIALRPEGGVLKFEMNDRCAAGTGKFLEFMALSLGVPLAEFGGFARRGRPGLVINSMCAVFAETEATSLLAQGRRPEEIALALHQAVVQRTLSMIRRVGLEPPLIFAGGVARNRCVVELLAQAWGHAPLVPEEPDHLGALGAALHGLALAETKNKDNKSRRSL